MNILWECRICKKTSVLDGNGKTLLHFGCDQQMHKKSEHNDLIAGELKCAICKRISFKDKWSDIHDGCSNGTNDTEIAGFHQICLDSIDNFSNE